MPWVIWITGLPGSGKSTIAIATKERVPDTVILNMDGLRKIITPSPDYSETEREYVYRSIVYTAKMLYELGHKVIIDATGNRRRWRKLAKGLIGNYFEVYLKCPLELCTERERNRTDTHGAPERIYDKAAKGSPVPGISAPYEEPQEPDLTISTDKSTIDTSVAEVMRMLDEPEEKRKKKD